nr:MAG TPA: hypothetical protein [Caudoviricetes sp.]
MKIRNIIYICSLICTFVYKISYSIISPENKMKQILLSLYNICITK